MRLVQPPADTVPFGLRAMVTIATADGPMSPAAANTLGAAQKLLLRSDLELASLAPITPAELARELVSPELRRQIVQGMLMLALSDGPPAPEKMTMIEAFAEALEVEGPELRTLRLLADEHMLFFRLHFLRRSHLARLATRSIAEEGLVAAARGILTMRGVTENPELAARYRALEALPADTLGAGLMAYFAKQGFHPPGEKGGFPEIGICHDLGHVLTGFDTDPAGELEMVAFQAGYMKHNPMYMLLFGALTFSAGVNVTPLPQEDTRGILATPGLPERIFRALELGGRVKVDLSDGWDHWQWLGRPIDEVRAGLGIAAS